eukprot:Hpha_TRINITY_DN1878_c0_g1::TRINITY_DN1878_c0_g1_i1::g.170529::m.170529
MPQPPLCTIIVSEGKQGRYLGEKDGVSLGLFAEGVRPLPAGFTVAGEPERDGGRGDGTEGAIARVWLTQVREPAKAAGKEGVNAHGFAEGFKDFVYPLDDALQTKMQARLGLLCSGLDKLPAEAARRIETGLKKAYRLAAPEGTDLLQEALVDKVAETARARKVVVTPALLQRIREVAVAEDASTGSLLSCLYSLLGSLPGPSVVWVPKEECIMPSASACRSLSEEFPKTGRRILLVVGTCGKAETSEEERITHIPEGLWAATRVPLDVQHVDIFPQWAESRAPEKDQGGLLEQGEQRAVMTRVEEASSFGWRVTRREVRKASKLREWPPASVRFKFTTSAAFCAAQEAPLRRLAILGMARADASESVRFGDAKVVEEEKKLAMAYIQRCEDRGWQLRKAVEAMWAGCRDAVELTEPPVDSRSSPIILSVLAALRAEEGVSAGASGAAEQPDGVVWEFNSSKGWVPFAPKDTKMLEKAFEAKEKVLESVSVSFSDFKHKYDFKAMEQTNLHSTFVRPIRRRQLQKQQQQTDEEATTPRAQPEEKIAFREGVEEWNIQAPTATKKAQLWRQLLRRDRESALRHSNVRRIKAALKDVGSWVDCPSVGESSDAALTQLLTQRNIAEKEADAVVVESIIHAVGVSALQSHDKRAVVPPESFIHAFETQCKVTTSGGGRTAMSRQELEKLVGKNEYEKGHLEGLVSPGDVRVGWDMVGGLEATKELLREAAVYPLKYPELYQVGVSAAPPGVLLYGPPGTGKTLLAKAVATETGASFLYVDSTSISSKYHGESDKFAKAVFTLARKVAPCVIFIDEIDSLAAARDSDESSVVATVKTTLLREWDGLAGDNEGIMVIGATNRPFVLDEAVLSRMPRRVFVNLPSTAELALILGVLLRGVPKEEGLDLERFARGLEGYAGRDVKELVRVAVLEASHQAARDFEARGVKQQSVSAADIRSVRRTVGIQALERARKKVPLASGGHEGAMLAEIKKWMKKHTDEIDSQERDTTFLYS